MISLIFREINWIYPAEQLQHEAATAFPFRLVQRPGEQNALGRYKFHFANNFNVYLHDTPDKALFDRADRALSSGCVRVERVDALANWFAANLVMDKQTWVARVNDPGYETQWFALSDVLAHSSGVLDGLDAGTR